jgi:hypothetical protein
MSDWCVANMIHVDSKLMQEFEKFLWKFLTLKYLYKELDLILVI